MRENPDSLQLLECLKTWQWAPRWWLGLSGGLDSCVLLSLLVQARGLRPLPRLTAIHVNHQLSPNSLEWEQHCAGLCRSVDVELVVRRVDVEAAASGPEAAAREARYTVFEELVEPGELLLLAHHQDDQVETFFLRLMRGAAARGLSGMPASRELGHGALARPLLNYSREQLEVYAAHQALSWVEDDSNRDLSLDRNYIRHNLLPVLEERWPGYRSSVLSSMSALADAEAGLAALDAETLRRAMTTRVGEPILQLGALPERSSVELARLLRRWLEAQGCSPPGRESLNEFVRQLATAEIDSQPSLGMPGYTLRRYRNAIHLCFDSGEVALPAPCELAPGRALSIPGLGRLELRAVRAGGMRLPACGYWHVKLREGGERCQPVGREHSQSLKKLLQDSAVPPWRRSRLPLLYADGELAAVADLWVCRGQEARGEPGYALAWERAGRVSPD